jgi:hypothetical protein
MKVKELIDHLSKFDPNVEVTITDGYRHLSYQGDFDVELFEDEVDIGIGGCTLPVADTSLYKRTTDELIAMRKAETR